jgi:hypothetical protein
MPFKSLIAFVSRLSGRERTIFYSTVFVVSLVLLDRLILAPILSKIADLDEIIKVQEQAVEQGLLIVGQEKRIGSESGLYSAYLSGPLAEEKEITAFLQEVEEVAKASSVYLIDIKPAGSSADEVSKRYLVKLNVEAQMDQVLNFFYNITTFGALLKIENYQLRPKAEGLSVVTCNITISKTIIPK